MGRMYEYTFKSWLIRKKKKSIFYYGEQNRTIYGDQSDFPGVWGHGYKYENTTLSDFQTINTSRFPWYDFFIPELKKVWEGNTHVHYVRGEHGNDDQIVYNVEAQTLGKQLMTEMFRTHTTLLDSAIRMCELSLTSKDWESYEMDYAEWLTTVPSSAFRGNRVLAIDTNDRAWGAGFWERPTLLLPEPAIEVLVHKSETYHPHGFHVDDLNMCFPGNNYGMATILLPASRGPRDRVAIQLSESEITRPEGSGDGVFVPSNVLYQDAPLYQDETREVYMIQLLANGMPHDKDNIGEHRCRDVKAFRMTLSELTDIKAVVRRNLNRIRQNTPRAALPRAPRPLVASTANPYTIHAPPARTNANI